MKDRERQCCCYARFPSLFTLCLALPASVKFFHLFAVRTALRRFKCHPSAFSKLVGRHSSLLLVSSCRNGKRTGGSSGNGVGFLLSFPSVLLRFCRELSKTLMFPFSFLKVKILLFLFLVVTLLEKINKCWRMPK